MKRELKAAIGATALLAGAASVVVVGGATSGNAAGVPSSAYGITASGLIAIPPTPFVESTDGSLEEDSVVSIPVDGLLDAGVINAAAENDHASASVASVDITGGLLQDAGLDAVLTPVADLCDQLLTPAGELINPVLDGTSGLVEDLLGTVGTVVTDGPLIEQPEVLGDLTAICDTVRNLGDIITVGAVEAECNDNTGNGTVAGLNILGLPVTLPAGANQELADGALGALADVVNIKSNTQTTNADGTFTVTALEISLLGQQTISIASATCGHVTNDVDPTDPAVPSAPSPKPIKTDVPVTG